MSHDFTRLDLLRHGVLATEGLFCADKGEPLGDQGIWQLIQTTQHHHWDVIVSSPYQRCLSFAEVLAKQTEAPLLIDEHFKEMDFGEWTGISAQCLLGSADKMEKISQLWQAPEDFCAPAGETMQAFRARVEDGLTELLKVNKNRTVLLITHAGVIRTILSLALDISLVSAMKFTVEYAQMSRLHHYDDGQFSLQFHGNSE